MTTRELSQVWYLKREIANDERRLAVLRAKAYPSACMASAIPTGKPSEPDSVGRIVAEIADQCAIIEAKKVQCAYELTRLERYISDIDDSLLRTVFTYRFVDGDTWERVARRVGGGNTAEGVKKRVQRYLRQAE